MHAIYESDIEELAIDLLKSQGCEYLYGPDIAPEGKKPERASFGEVVLVDRLKHAIDMLNPAIPEAAREQALREVLSIASPDLIDGNEIFHRCLTEGVEVEYQQDGVTRGDKVWLIDWDEPENNEFLVVNQFTVIEKNPARGTNINKRPDVILFINGLPLAVIELKNPADEKATVRSAFRQVQTYKAVIPSLFIYNVLLVISDGADAKAGAVVYGILGGE